MEKWMNLLSLTKDLRLECSDSVLSSVRKLHFNLTYELSGSLFPLVTYSYVYS